MGVVARPKALSADEDLLWRSLMQHLIRIPLVTGDDFAHDRNLATSEYVVSNARFGGARPSAAHVGYRGAYCVVAEPNYAGGR